MQGYRLQIDTMHYLKNKDLIKADLLNDQIIFQLCTFIYNN